MMISDMPIQDGETDQFRIAWRWMLPLAVLVLATQFGLKYIPPEMRVSEIVIQSFGRRRMAVLSLGFIGVVLFIRARGWRMRWYPPLFLVGISLVVWTALSILWSYDQPSAMRRFMVLALLAVGAFGLTARWPRYMVLPFIVLSASLHVVFGLFQEIYHGGFTPFAPGYRLSGALHPNDMGKLCAVLALTAFAASRSPGRSRMFYRFTAFSGVVCVLFTRSLSSLAGLVAGLAVFFFLQFSSGSRLRFVYLGAMALLVLALLMSGSGFSIDPIAKITGRNPETMTSLTGRIPLWTACIRYIPEHPIKGFGFEGFWTYDHRKDVGYEIGGWRPITAHSGYLDLWLTLGLIGLALHTSTLLLVLRRSAVVFRATKVPLYAAAAGLSVQYLVIGALETTTLVRFSPFVFYSYCLFIMVAVVSRSARGTARQMHVPR